MSIETNADIKGNEYGIYNYDKKNKCFVFTALGKAAFIEEIFENIETDEVELKLSFEYQNDKKIIKVPRDVIFNKTKIDVLTKKGVDVTTKTFNAFVDTIRLQEQDNSFQFDFTYTYKNQGWIYLPLYDGDGKVSNFDLCYRANELVGNHSAKYVGIFDTESNGSFAEWKEMVVEEIVGNPVAEMVLIASMAATIVGVLAIEISIENPILHFYHLSGRGKTTMAMLATSVYGPPFQGKKMVYDTNEGKFVEKRSLLQTWSSTSNALVTSQAGNRGVATILDELGKYNGKNPRDVIFNFSEGSDKNRLDKELKSHISEGYNTVFLSFGESSLLEKCPDKLEGLNVRVLEIDAPLTKSAEQARKIKHTTVNNNGWAASKLAQFIIDNEGAEYVRCTYDLWISALADEFPKTASSERIIEKFYALFMTTAEIARNALEIEFDMEGLLNFFKETEEKNAHSRATSAESFDVLIEMFNINENKFYQEGKQEPKGEVWGKIKRKNRIAANGKTVIAEYAVRRTVVHKLLKEQGFLNLKSCIYAWKKASQIEYDNDNRNTRSRVIQPGGEQEDVYVFVVYDDDQLTKKEGDEDEIYDS